MLMFDYLKLLSCDVFGAAFVILLLIFVSRLSCDVIAAAVVVCRSYRAIVATLLLMSQAESIRHLIELIRTGSLRNKENAAGILGSQCMSYLKPLKLAKEPNAEQAL
ncbi:unnamed protein product [Amaranthus hypochondriacus]